MQTPTERCPACGGQDLRPSLSTPRVELVRCAACGHRVARHKEEGAGGVDYHRQYEQGAFVDALAATRARQSRLLLELLRERMTDLDRVLDFGAGRGWFLDECRSQGLAAIAGADTSEVAVGALRSRGIPALQLQPPAEASAHWPLPLDELPFRPRVLTLLDVVEHFPAELAPALLGHLVAQLGPQLEWVVVKVPLGDGLLYQVATALSRVGMHRPLEQLYQSGTFPPHFSYFSRGSAPRLLEAAGLELVRTVLDPDFEPDQLTARVAALQRLPRAAGRLAGTVAVGVGKALGRADSGIFLARPRR